MRALITSGLKDQPVKNVRCKVRDFRRGGLGCRALNFKPAALISWTLPQRATPGGE
jgi:hypothetical protein